MGEPNLRSPSSRECRHLLVTGGAGFIGSNFVHYWCQHYPHDRVVILDSLTYAGNLNNLTHLETANLRFVQGDICDRALVNHLLQAEHINTLVHFAAESHVDRSILGPAAFVQTNVTGTFTLLEAFRQHWHTNGNQPFDRFLHISTDEVYGSLGSDEPAFCETAPYAPNSPYSASKAASDHFVRAYHKTYGVPTIVTHSSNNYGAYQFPEKLIPLFCVNILLGKPLPLYGDGQNIRDWLHVDDHCRALDAILHRGQVGEVYNIGGNNELKNIDLVNRLCTLMDELAPNLPISPSRSLITWVRDRPGHDRRYAINATKLQTELGWMPQETIATGLQKTITWYLNHRDWWQPLLSSDYQAYYQQIYVRD